MPEYAARVVVTRHAKGCHSDPSAANSEDPSLTYEGIRSCMNRGMKNPDLYDSGHVFVSVLLRTWLTAILLYNNKPKNVNKEFHLHVIPGMKEGAGRGGGFLGENTPGNIEKGIYRLLRFLDFLNVNQWNEEGAETAASKLCSDERWIEPLIHGHLDGREFPFPEEKALELQRYYRTNLPQKITLHFHLDGVSNDANEVPLIITLGKELTHGASRDGEDLSNGRYMIQEIGGNKPWDNDLNGALKRPPFDQNGKITTCIENTIRAAVDPIDRSLLKANWPTVHFVAHGNLMKKFVAEVMEKQTRDEVIFYSENSGISEDDDSPRRWVPDNDDISGEYNKRTKGVYCSSIVCEVDLGNEADETSSEAPFTITNIHAANKCLPDTEILDRYLCDAGINRKDNDETWVREKFQERFPGSESSLARRHTSSARGQLVALPEPEPEPEPYNILSSRQQADVDTALRDAKEQYDTAMAGIAAIKKKENEDITHLQEEDMSPRSRSRSVDLRRLGEVPEPISFRLQPEPEPEPEPLSFRLQPEPEPEQEPERKPEPEKDIIINLLEQFSSYGCNQNDVIEALDASEGHAGRAAARLRKKFKSKPKSKQSRKVQFVVEDANEPDPDLLDLYKVTLKKARTWQLVVDIFYEGGNIYLLIDPKLDVFNMIISGDHDALTQHEYDKLKEYRQDIEDELNTNKKGGSLNKKNRKRTRKRSSIKKSKKRRKSRKRRKSKNLLKSKKHRKSKKKTKRR